VRPRLTLHKLAELATRHLRDIDQRAERPRREQGIARPPQHTRRTHLITETPQQKRLPNTRLTANEHETAVSLTAHRGNPRRQGSQRALPLEE
jgi:hypothetical protein